MGSCSGRNQSRQISTRSVQGVRSPRWPKIAISHWLEVSPLTTVYALTCYTVIGRFTHIGLVVTRRLQAERRTGSVRRPKTGVPPTVLRNQPMYLRNKKSYMDVDSNENVVEIRYWVTAACQPSMTADQLTDSSANQLNLLFVQSVATTTVVILLLEKGVGALVVLQIMRGCRPMSPTTRVLDASPIPPSPSTRNDLTYLPRDTQSTHDLAKISLLEGNH